MINYFNGKWWLYYSVSEFGTNNSAHVCQEWELIELENQQYKIINRNSAKALTLSEDGNLVQKNYSGLAAQKWQLQPL